MKVSLAGKAAYGEKSALLAPGVHGTWRTAVSYNTGKRNRGFDKLRALSGDWEGTVAWTGKPASKVSAHYYVTGNGSAVVEDLSNGMTSVYHLDSADLRVTHYCAAQNQPRLKAEFPCKFRVPTLQNLFSLA